MKEIFISSFDMQIGGVERSLISLLDNFDYERYNLDLMLYKHEGEFMDLLPSKQNLLDEIVQYASFRKSIKELFKERELELVKARIKAKIKAKLYKCNGESGYIQMQLMWKYSLKYLPKINKQYDVAISYLWPHYFVAEKVNAKKKIAWIHTDYSKLETDEELDLQVWNKFNYIVAVSEDCKKAFLLKYPTLENKVMVMENITSPEFIRQMSNEKIINNISKKSYFNLLTIARLSHAKGIDNAVKALREIYNRGLTNIRWYVIGYGGDEKMIKNLIKENNLEKHFILLGKKVNPYPYLKQCNLYVQPSRYEGKAVTVTEAKILGKPVMITNYATAKSQIKHNIDGYITELSVDGIADGIEYLYKNKEVLDKYTHYCKNQNYSNNEELQKLYQLF